MASQNKTEPKCNFFTSVILKLYFPIKKFRPVFKMNLKNLKGNSFNNLTDNLKKKEEEGGKKGREEERKDKMLCALSRKPLSLTDAENLRSSEK